MNSCNRLLVLLACTVIMFACAYGHAADREQGFETLKQRYMSLRNTDPDLARADDWKILTAELISFAAKKKSQNAPMALFYAAILSSTVADVYQEEECTSVALSALADLVRDYPESDIADDALLMAGDLSAAAPNGKKEAKAFYERIISDYSDGDMVLVARERSRQLDQQTAEPTGVSVLPWEEPGAKPSVLRVVLDPGHGGEDRGAVGEGDLFEKDVTLSVALEAEKILESQGYEVLLTREGDSFVPLAERTAFANASDAAVFVSLHTNASLGSKVSGVETFILDNSNNDAALKLAARENAGGGELESPGDLEFIVSDMIQKGKAEASKRLARALQKSLLASIRSSGEPLPDLGVQKGPFYVLVGAHMPCVLVEMGFIDNSRDGRQLSDKDFRGRLAQGIASGIDEFLKKELPHE